MPGRNLAAWFLLRRVTFWLGRKSPKTHQREIPLESPGLICFFRFRPKSALGLVGRIGWLGAPLGRFYSAGSIYSFYQCLKSGRSVLRPAAVGRGVPQVGPKTGVRRTIPAATEPKRATFPSWYGKRPSARSEKHPLTPRKAGWIPQGGGRPLLWRFFPPFLIGEKWGPAERIPIGMSSRTAKSTL